MAITGRRVRSKSNRISKVGGLPLEFSKGSISVNINFESHPTGTINILSIPEDEIENYRQTYNVQGKELTLFTNTQKPIFFRINGYAETEAFTYQLNQTSSVIKAYDIAINLEGGHLLDSSKDVYIRNNSRDYVPSSEPRLNVTNGRILLSNLARAAGVNYQGFNETIPLESTNGSNYTINFQSTLETYLRTKRTFADYSGPAVRTTAYNRGQIWNVGFNDILDSIEISRDKPVEFRNTLLQPKDGDTFALNSNRATNEELKEQELLGDQPERLDPVTVELEEGDLFPTLPPEDVTRITTLDLVFDKSGPRKTLRRTNLVNGQPFEEEVFVYGFVYTADQIKNPAALEPTATIDTSALLAEGQEVLNGLWQQIEYQRTVYNYEELNLRVRVSAKNSNGQRLDVVYLDSSGSNATKFNSKYLTSIITTGWKLTRFQAEELASADAAVEDILDTRLINQELSSQGVTLIPNPDGSVSPVVPPSDDEINFYIKTLQSLTFKRTPFQSVTQYKLFPSEDYYNSIESAPFQIQEVPGADIGYPNEPTVVVAIPDTQWVYPMLVLEETTLSQSFDLMDNPRNVFIRADRLSIINDATLTQPEKIQGLAETPLLEDLTVGEDTFEKRIRKILKSKFTNPRRVGVDRDQEDDIFVEYSQRASSHDQNYRNSIQNIEYTSSLGRPTEATVFQERFGSTEDNQEDEASTRQYEYRLTSSTDENAEVIESVQYETNRLSTAQLAARADLSLQHFLNSYEEQINLAWYYPEVRPGDYLEFLDEPNKGLRKVKNIQFTVDYQDYVEGEILVTCSGTQLTLGRWEDKTFTTRRVQKNSTGDIEIETNISGERKLGRSVFLDIRTRRNRAALPITPLDQAI